MIPPLIKMLINDNIITRIWTKILSLLGSDDVLLSMVPKTGLINHEDALRSLKMLRTTCPVTQHCIPEDLDLQQHQCVHLSYQNNVTSVACLAYLQLLNSQLIVLVHISKLFLCHFFSNSDFTHLLLFKFQGNPQLLKLRSSLHYYKFLLSQLLAQNKFSVSLTYSTITFSLVVKSHAIGQEITCHLWKPTVHYCASNCELLFLTFSPIKNSNPSMPRYCN